MAKMIRIKLTVPQARALLTMCTSAEAGDLSELFRSDDEVSAAVAQRAIDAVRNQVNAADPHA